jgi:hypothetical protein
MQGEVGGNNGACGVTHNDFRLCAQGAEQFMQACREASDIHLAVRQAFAKSLAG